MSDHNNAEHRKSVTIEESEKKKTILDRLDVSFGELLHMYQDEELIISPEYQRAFRWDNEKQSALIESILLGLPLPSIFVFQNENGTYELLDGLQRLSTVFAFMGELKDVKNGENQGIISVLKMLHCNPN